MTRNERELPNAGSSKNKSNIDQNQQRQRGQSESEISNQRSGMRNDSERF